MSSAVSYEYDIEICTSRSWNVGVRHSQVSTFQSSPRSITYCGNHSISTNLIPMSFNQDLLLGWPPQYAPSLQNMIMSIHWWCSTHCWIM